jgi:hypothetical protein
MRIPNFVIRLELVFLFIFIAYSSAVCQSLFPVYREGANHFMPNRMGFINKKGEITIDFQYYSVSEFRDGLAIAQKGRDYKEGYIDVTGKFVIEPLFDEAFLFSDGLAKVRTSKKWKYIKSNGETLKTPEVEQAHDFSEKLAAVKINGR